MAPDDDEKRDKRFVELVEMFRDSNAKVREIAANERRRAAALEDMQQSLYRWMIERDELSGRVRALEAWRTEVEKKTRH